MFRVRLAMFSLLLMASSQLAGAQTLDSRNRQVTPNPTSENLKTNNTPYSKEELKQREEEAKKYYNLGQKYGHAGLFKQAAQLFLMSIELKPDYANAYFGLGHAYYDLGRWADAVEAFKKVIELNPKDKEAFMRLDASEEKLRAQATLPDRENGQAVGEATALDLPTNRQPGESVSDPMDEQEASLLELYKVGKGDVLEINLPDAPGNQATLFTVPGNGLVELPSLNQPIKVLDLTPEEITRNLKESIGRGANSGNVLVAVREYNSHAIMVSGLVKEPGTKMLRREAIPLYVVLADAQPLPEAGQVVVVRRAGAPMQFDLRESQSRSIIVRPGDVITVQVMPTQYFYVGGEVKDPGEKVFRPGLTLTQAILSAGGVTEKGKKIELGRERSGGLLATINYKLKDITSGKVPDVPIQPGDRITVVH
jgi:polysaccharide biosynthesis/export protein